MNHQLRFFGPVGSNRLAGAFTALFGRKHLCGLATLRALFAELFAYVVV
jgi:hypothetical protein